MSWPHNDDGTVDWETVFDDPDVGLIPFMERVKSPAALSQCAHVIVQSLFTRSQDDASCKAFNAAIDALISTATDTDGEGAKRKMLLLLNEIKANRIQYAAQYLDSDADEDNRRSTAQEPIDALKTLENAD